MHLTIYKSTVTGNAKNCVYPNEHIIRTEKEMIGVVKHDHVCARFENNYRSKDNFLECDCDVFDCDNEHSDNPDDWIYPEDYEFLLGGASFVVVPSRNDGKVKNGKSARPRHHLYIPHKSFQSAKMCEDFKKAIYQNYPFLDSNALDAARFIFGHDVHEIIWFEGSVSIEDVIGFKEEDDFTIFDNESDFIQSGSRNATMSHIAGKLIKRYGNTDECFELFLKEAEKCNPPLEDAELRSIWFSAVKFGNKISKQEGYISPEEYGRSYEEYKPSELTDIAMAEIFASHTKDKAIYTVSGGWLYWTGKKWERSELKVMNLYMDIAKFVLKNATFEFKNAYRKLLDAEMDGDKEVISKAKNEVNKAKQYLAFAKKMNDHSKVSGIVKLGKSMLEVSNDTLDKNAFVLNTPVGVVDLKTGELKKHHPQYYCTKMTSVAPKSDNMDLWIKTLDDVTDGDKEYQNFLQYHAGSTLIGKVYEEALLLVYGNGGNGKSTVFNSEAFVLGDYAGKIPAESLTTRAKNVKVDLAELCGKRFILASETEEGQRLSASMLKQIASVDDISAERKYYAPFSFTPSHSTILYTNHLPKVGSNDRGTWRRILVAPFNTEIKNPKTDYVEELLKKSGGAILKWMIEGSQLYIKNGYKYPSCKVVDDAKKVYRDENNWIEHFIVDCCEVDKTKEVMSNELYQTYRQWSVINGEYTRNTRDFASALLNSGYEKRRTNKGVKWSGLGLNDDTNEFL